MNNEQDGELWFLALHFYPNEELCRMLYRVTCSIRYTLTAILLYIICITQNFTRASGANKYATLHFSFLNLLIDNI